MKSVPHTATSFINHDLKKEENSVSEEKNIIWYYCVSIPTKFYIKYKLNMIKYII